MGIFILHNKYKQQDHHIMLQIFFRRTLTITFVVLFYSILPFSHVNAQGFMRIDSTVTRLKTRLVLTDSQVVHVKEIVTQAQKEMMTLREAFQEDRAAMMEAMRERMLKTDTEIEALLTDEQKNMYEEVKKERQAQRQQRMQRRRDEN